MLRFVQGAQTPRYSIKVTVEYYGAQTPLAQSEQYLFPKARTIIIQPWDAEF